MFNLFGKKKKSAPTFKIMSDAELNAKYDIMNSTDPYVQYAITGNLEHAAKYARTPAEKKAFADAKAANDAYNEIFSKMSDGHTYVASDIGTDLNAFNKMMRDPKATIIFK